MENTIYELIDTKTQKVIGTYSYAQRNRARARRDKLDLQYGAVRYILKPTNKKGANKWILKK